MQHEHTPNPDVLKGYKSVKAWFADNAYDVFQTIQSLEWFIRANKKELIECGELIVRGGSTPNLLGPGMGTLTLEILKRKSAERIGEGFD